MARQYGRGKFEAHEKYIQYMDMIVNHEAYAGMPNAVSPDGHINWQVSSGKNTSFFKYYQARFKWWITQADRLKLPGKDNEEERFSIAARLIHPTGYRPCRLCGELYNIGYFYANYSLCKKIKKQYGLNIHKGTAINEILVDVSETGVDVEEFCLKLFPERKQYFKKYGIHPKAFESSNHLRSNYLSPGFMCNPPDRLDGFHDYALCCRKKKDPGRSDENMRSYNHDRRAFMWWSQGDWLLSDALYNSAGPGKCVVCGKSVKKVSPDHVGPLSCGFKQIPYFVPMCTKHNSSKNRRLTPEDVKLLLKYEKDNNVSVASWQVQSIWDKNKSNVCDALTARELSNLMRAFEDVFLRTMNLIKEKGHAYFLACQLSPENAFYDIQFEDLNDASLTFASVKKIPNTSKLRYSMAARAIRIAFEELENYVEKDIAVRKVTSRIYDAHWERIESAVNALFSSKLNPHEEKWNNSINSRDTGLKEKFIQSELPQLLDEKESIYIDKVKSLQNLFAEISADFSI